MKEKKGEKNIIIDVLEEITAEKSGENAFFLFKPYKQQ